jgi:GNAT superfamily N-acetyltransferase
MDCQATSSWFDEYGYVTNVYTRPEYRGLNIGSKLMDYVKDWATEIDFEILIVWPSSKAVNFYERKGFKSDNDVMELVIRPDE